MHFYSAIQISIYWPSTPITKKQTLFTILCCSFVAARIIFIFTVTNNLGSKKINKQLNVTFMNVFTDVNEVPIINMLKNNSIFIF